MGRNTRESNTRTIKKRIIIATEGSKTEPKYFNCLKQKFRSDHVAVTVLKRNPKRTEPEDVIQCLNNYKEQHHNELDQNDELWAVIDHDGRPEKVLNNVAREAKKENYCLADSNPCFELWLLLHHKRLNQFKRLEASGDNRACSPAESELEKLDRSYDKDNKGRLNTSKYISRITTAIQYAKETDTQETPLLNQIGTRVYLLAQSVIKSSPSSQRLDN